MAEERVDTTEFRLRLIDLEYENLPEEEMVKRIEEIYIEEYGEKLDANIEIFHSSQSDNPNIKDSGYDGTAIHFSSEDKENDEVYVISQGTQDMVDWDYNIKAMFAGLDGSQALATDTFVKEFMDQFGIDEETEVPVTCLSHSLAHN